MKYSSSNKPLICMQTQSTCYKGTKKFTPVGILWHSTGANNPNLKRYIQPSDTKPAADTYSKAKWLEILGTNTNKNDWNHINREAGLNCWIGKLADGTVTTVQTMPWDYRPWGCGSGSKGSCNNGWIQFEICEDGLTDATYFNKVYKEACEITAYLCQLYNIDPNGTVTVNGVKVPTITCHQDAYKLGFGSNHSDVNHWFPKHGKSMATARTDVAALIKAAKGTTTTTTTTESATAVKTYKLVVDVNKYSTSADAKAKTNSKGTMKAGTYYILKNYPNGYNGMYNLTTDKTGTEAGSWINPAENVAPVQEETVQKLYRVRTSWDNAKSQKGAYASLANAKECCQTAGQGYKVYDWNGKEVYAYIAPVVTLSSIAITTKPKKLEYTIGDTYDGTGLVVTATYSDKSTKTVTGYSVSGFSSTKAGTVTINVIFEGKATTFAVTIKEKEVIQETPKEPEVVIAVYDLDYPEKNKIVDKAHVGTNANCTKAIKKILSNNSSFDAEIAKTFFKLAPRYGIDPMMAIAQAILETGWFKFVGSAVTADQHNYCGLGVTSTGVKGAEFDTIEDGVTAQLQHLFAYGCKDALPAGETVLDPRFSLVTRGIAQYWQQLAGRWACPGYDKAKYSTPTEAMKAGNTYGQKIRAIYDQLCATTVSDAEVQKYFQVEIEEPKVDIEENKPSVDDIKADPKEDIKEDPKLDIEEKTDVDTPDIDVSDDDTKIDDNSGVLVKLIFDIIKKLIQVFINVFSKGE